MKFKFVSLFVLGAFAVSSPAVADDTTDLYFQQVIDRYYNLQPTARVGGMAGASYLTNKDSSAMIGNPAGLAFMRQGEVSGTYSYDTVSGSEFPTDRSIEQNTNSGMGLLALPLSPRLNDLPEYGNFGLGWYGSDGSWDDDSFDTETTQTRITASYAMAMAEDWSLGYALTWTRDKIQSNEVFDYPMANGWRHDLGAMFDLDEALTLGTNLVIGHGTHHALFGPGFKGKSDTFQAGIGVGLQYQMEETLLAAAVDYSHLKTEGDVRESIPENFIGGDEKGNIFNVRLGVEQGLGETFKIRGGYRFAGLADYDYSRTELDGIEGDAYYHALSLGAGLGFDTGWHYVPKASLDYGVEYRAAGDDDWQHFVTLTAPIELCAPAA